MLRETCEAPTAASGAAFSNFMFFTAKEAKPLMAENVLRCIMTMYDRRCQGMRRNRLFVGQAKYFLKCSQKRKGKRTT
jgi:hypothetical protein